MCPPRARHPPRALVGAVARRCGGARRLLTWRTVPLDRPQVPRALPRQQLRRAALLWQLHPRAGVGRRHARETTAFARPRARAPSRECVFHPPPLRRGCFPCFVPSRARALRGVSWRCRGVVVVWSWWWCRGATHTRRRVGASTVRYTVVQHHGAPHTARVAARHVALTDRSCRAVRRHGGVSSRRTIPRHAGVVAARQQAYLLARGEPADDMP